MKNLPLVLAMALCLTACNKTAAPAAASNGPVASSSPKGPDAVQDKLKEASGANPTDCGRLDVRAPEAQLKTASECAMKASQGKQPFYVAYDMPGMTVGVAGNSEGKLSTVQSHGGGMSAGVTIGACPSALRVASSGRVTCFAPGDMGSMSDSHTAASVPTGVANPHPAGSANPHAATKPK